MKKQFLHEHHNRQDKAGKPDYQEEMRLKSPTYPRYPDFGRLKARREAREHEVSRVRKCRFFLDGHQFKFGWPLAHFAKVNELPVTELATKRAYEKIQRIAELDMQDITQAIINGSIRKCYLLLKGGRKVCLGLGVVWEVESIRCDEIRK